jgi:dihydrodipicolinate synthase/N-acetylneuraminate lyase
LKLGGVIVPSITIFNENYEVNLRANLILYNHILLNGADSIFLFGSMGEGLFFHNNIKEKIKLIELAYHESDNKIPILCGIFGNQADEILNQMEQLGEVFKDLYFVLAPPFKKKLNFTELDAFLENSIGSFNLHNKIILYNNPTNFAKNEIKTEHIKKLIKFSNVKGIKDTTKDIKNTQSYVQFMNQDFGLYCGNEDNYAKFYQLVPSKLRKFSGVVPSTSNIANVCKKLFNNALKGKENEVEEMQNQLNNVMIKIYDEQPYPGKEQRSLKFALYTLYKNEIFSSLSEIMNLSPELHKSLSDNTKERIKNNIQDLINLDFIQILKVSS